jgi:hypothetical protein
MLTSLIIALAIFVLVLWIISLLPLPASPPFRLILYIFAALILILYLASYL